MKNWDILNTHCRRDLVRKITIAGTESTGKSTLAQRLADHFNTACVTEAARDIVLQTCSCNFEDLHLIAEAHAQAIEDGLSRARRLLFLDTDIYTTISYGTFLFGIDLEISSAQRELNRSDLTLYLDKGSPYVQDGTRLERPARDALDGSHRTVLENEHIPYTILTGSHENRFAEALRLVEQLMPF